MDVESLDFLLQGVAAAFLQVVIWVKFGYCYMEAKMEEGVHSQFRMQLRHRLCIFCTRACNQMLFWCLRKFIFHRSISVVVPTNSFPQILLPKANCSTAFSTCVAVIRVTESEWNFISSISIKNELLIN